MYKPHTKEDIEKLVSKSFQNLNFETGSLIQAPKPEASRHGRDVCSNLTILKQGKF